MPPVNSVRLKFVGFTDYPLRMPLPRLLACDKRQHNYASEYRMKMFEFCLFCSDLDRSSVNALS